MSKRLTIIAIVATTVGLLSRFAAAQTVGADPTIQAGCIGCDQNTAAGQDGAGLSSARASLFPNIGRMGMGCRPHRAWGTFEALLWWGKGRTVPPLVTTSPQGTVQDDAGVLDRTGTEILFGNGTVGNQIAAGARADFGFWIDSCENLGVGAKVWGIAGDRAEYSATSPAADPILARPFYNVVLDRQDSLLVAFPGLVTGDLNVTSDSSAIGVEAYLRSSMLAGRGYNLDLIGGYHFVQLSDELTITNRSVSTNPKGFVPIGTTFDVADNFITVNDFHGGEVGFAGEARHGKWTLSGLTKLSVGNMRQRVRIDGSSAITTPNSMPTVTAGGLLALPTNMGRYSRDKVALIPEVNVTLAYRVRDWLNLSIGYNAIYWTDVVLAGDQIDMNVNPTQLNGGIQIGPDAPTFAYRNTDYWMHGLTLGATLTY